LSSSQHVAFVREVPKERALGQPGTIGDLGNGGVVEALL
jgi:hypothetical protein